MEATPRSTSPAPEVWTVEDCARRAQVHPKTVLRAIRAGRLRAARLGERGAYRIRPEDFWAWFDGSVIGEEQAPLPGVEWTERSRRRGAGRLVVHEGMGRTA